MSKAKQFTCPCCGNKSDHLDYEEQGDKWSYFTCDGEYKDDHNWTNVRHLYHCPQCFEVLALSEEQAKQLFKPKAKNKSS